jgi:hypothetical protein
MNQLSMRVLGFAIPTIAIVTALHLDKQIGTGEAIDGVVSGLAFTLPFALVAWLRSRLEGDRASARARSRGQEFLFGLFASLVAWAGLWVGWSLPALQSQRPNAFWWNCAVMALAGLMLPAAGRGARDPEPMDEPATTH